MNGRRRAFILAPGVLFRGTPIYAEPRQLDSLARFFYDEVLPRETDLGRLRRLFGLPTRVVDEVLADLVRLHYATLNVATRRVIRVQNPAPHPGFFEMPPVEFWQDGLTGAVVRYSDLPHPFRQQATKGDDREVLLEGALKASALDFRRISGARLVSMLRATSPRMVSLVSGAELETIVRPTFIAERYLRVPLQYATVDLGELAFVREPGLPRLLTRAWSREVNRQLGGRPDAVASDIATRGPDAQAPDLDLSLLEATSLAEGISSFLQGLATLSEHRRGSGLRAVRDDYQKRRDALLGRVESVSAADVATPSAGFSSHVAEMWAAARQYLLLVIEGDSEQPVRVLADVLGEPDKWTATVILIEKADNDARRCARFLPQDVSPDLLQCVAVDVLPTTGLCIRDGVELRFGTLADLTSDEAVPRLAGGPVPPSLAARLSGAFHSRASRLYLRGLLDPGRSGEARRAALSTDRGDVGVVDELLRLVQDADLLVSKALQSVRRDWFDRERGTDVDDAEVADEHSGPRSLRDVEPDLRRVESKLDSMCGTPVPAPLAACHQLWPASPVDVLADAVRSLMAHEARSLVVTFDRAGAGLDGDAFRRLLNEVLGKGCQVALYLSPLAAPGPETRWDPESIATLGRLEADVPHHLLRIQRKGSARVPTSLVLNDALVVLGHGTWFDEGSGNEVLVALEAPHLALQLRSIVEMN